MKEVIVIFATIILGVAIAGFVVGLDSTAEAVTDGAATKVNTFVQNPNQK